ncbi:MULTISPECIES: SgcJ/EcaC family oxidoreductase [unclassified Dietzia]|uniref:SgcJ/EcaC family oxidoreductase n=1 Tax=unclassified Dietzia TaxID=2617939 RepID=UPI000D2270BA|nr:MULTISPECIES: SgcJ/EcaC family oxidoreductase [unclassified Dietzia]AVZ41376.1 delta(5)-3-ketosteroid isomerase [Dietzia sp. JS16-p6b]MBB1023413.1 SgcJ/EcaC family oxidoreductase [Dietzia sp. DQ12-76]MBB1027484.1 SgcJ/EcaC family oxidoreductase [Dietzia sp. DQ11-38-2]QGW26524.1 nuclear transport factor 2 [Dietzia sp. DQ12-45-1b]
MSASPEQIRATADSYIAALVAGDLEAVLDLYAENATVEDPVGNGTVHEGKAAIREFYSSVVALKIEGEVLEARVCGDDLLFNFEITTHFDENSSATINVWDLMTHDEQGKVASMRAYWTPENMR